MSQEKSKISGAEQQTEQVKNDLDLTARLKYEAEIIAKYSQLKTFKERIGLLAFPDEILLDIANLLDFNSVQQFSLVCQQLRKLIVERYTRQGETFIALLIRSNVGKKEEQRQALKRLILSKFREGDEDAYINGIRWIEQHKSHIDQAVILDIESRSKEILENVVDTKKYFTRKYWPILGGVNGAVVTMIAFLNIPSMITRDYYPKDKFHHSFCEDNFTYQNITICQDTVDSFLYNTSRLWYLNGIAVGLGVQILDMYLYKYLIEKKFKQILPSLNDTVSTTKEKISKILWSVYYNRNHILLIPCLALFVTQFQLNNPGAEECIIFEENDYFQINHECLDPKVNERAEEFFYLASSDGFLIGFALVSMFTLLVNIPCKVAKWVENSYEDYGFFGNSADSEAIPLSTSFAPKYSGGGA